MQHRFSHAAGRGVVEGGQYEDWLVVRLAMPGGLTNGTASAAVRD